MHPTGTFAFVDNPPTGNEHTNLISAGDFSAGTVKLYDKSGRRAGSLHLVCVATVSGQECTRSSSATAP